MKVSDFGISKTQMSPFAALSTEIFQEELSGGGNGRSPSA
jgi:hypothetical protein